MAFFGTIRFNFLVFGFLVFSISTIRRVEHQCVKNCFFSFMFLIYLTFLKNKLIIETQDLFFCLCFIGVCGQHDDEDELDEDSNSKSKRDRHESSNSKMDSFVIVDDSNSELKKSTKNNENISDSVVVTTTTAAVNVTHQNNVQHRTRLPSFSSIIAGIL